MRVLYKDLLCLHLGHASMVEVRGSSLALSRLTPPFPQMESLFGSLPEMLEFQKVFLETLEDGVSASSDFSVLETPSQFRVSPFGFAFKANTSGSGVKFSPK